MRSVTNIIMNLQHVNMSVSNIYYITENCEALEAIWMHTSVSSRFDLETPLGGPMSLLIIQNCSESLCEHGKGMLEHQ